MTRITLVKDPMSVTARGHANAADGEDGTGGSVCAAVSMLLCALGDFALENGGAVLEDDGYMTVLFPQEENEYLFGGFDAIAGGLYLIADTYPENVEIEDA